MKSDLEQKCENLFVLLSCNLYICDETGLLARFAKLQAPAFLTRRIEGVIEKFTAAHLKAQDMSKDRVLLYLDPLHLGYLSVPAAAQNGASCMVACGPLLFERLSREELRYAAQKMKLGGENRAMFETFLGIVPYFSQEALERLGRVLAEYFRAGFCKSELLVENHTVDLEHGPVPLDEKFEEHSFVLENYAMEGKLLRAVENGDVELIRNNLNSAMHAFSIPPRYPGDPLRETKNLSITANSIMLRAAISGGLDASLAHSMSHAFAVRIEQQTNSEFLWQMIPEIAVTYAQAVREYAIKDHSELIVHAIGLVRRGLSSPISLAEIAGQLHVSREYLCRRFTAEMGETLTDYIHRSKIRESCPLLASRRYDIGEIAALFGYSSPSHYTKTFQKHMGVSPKVWQQAHGAKYPEAQ